MSTSTLHAGHQLRQLRIAKQLTQQEVADRSGGELSMQAVSRLETGALARPSFYEVVAYAKVLGISPNEVARMYGYWTDGTELRDEDFSITRARSVMQRLPPEQQAELAHWIDFAVAQALANAAPK